MRNYRSLLTCVAFALGACAAPPPATTPIPAPAKAAATSPAAVPLTNPGFEVPHPSRPDHPLGWSTFQHAGDRSYNFVLDTVAPHGGARSLRIDNVGPEPYGAVAQSIEAAPHIGKVARLTAWVRTRDVSEVGAVLTVLTLTNGVPLQNNFMTDKPVKGTTQWTRYTIALPVTKGAERIEVGAMLQGKGSLWLDDVEVEFVTP